jgi:copper(I)-binding protein
MKRITLAALMFAAFPVMAQVTVKDPWVRATVPAQKATGAFMQITSARTRAWSKPNRRSPAWSRSMKWSWKRMS